MFLEVNKLKNLIFKYQKMAKEQHSNKSVILKEYNNEIEKLENNLEKENENYEKLNQQRQECEEKIKNNDFQIEMLKMKIKTNKKKNKEIIAKQFKLKKENDKLKIEMEKNDNEKYQSIKDKIHQYSKEANKEQLKVYSDLITSEIDDSTLTKRKEEKSQFFNKIIDINIAELFNLTKEQKEINNELLNLTSDLNNIQKEKLPKNKQEFKKLKQDNHQQENIIKDLKTKIEKHTEEIKEKYNSIDKEFQEKLKEYFGNLKEIIKEIKIKNNDLRNEKKLFEPIVVIKEKINEFLAKYFIEKNTDINDYYDTPNQTKEKNKNIVDGYDSDFNQIKEKIDTGIKDENLKTELINNWELFNNWNANNCSSTQLFSNRLQANPGEILIVTFKYQCLLKNYKNSFSHLLCIGTLKEDVKVKLFAKIYLVDECNEEEKEIFNILMKKIKKLEKKFHSKQQYIVFNKKQEYALPLLKNKEQELMFLVDFTNLVKIPDNFSSLINNYQKISSLNVSKLDEIFNNILEQNKKRLLKFSTNKSITVTNNNLEFYIKQLDLFFQDVFTKKSDLEQEILNLKENIEKINDNILEDLKSQLTNKNNNDQQQETYEEKILKETWISLKTLIEELKKQKFKNQIKEEDISLLEQKSDTSISGQINTQDAMNEYFDQNQPQEEEQLQFSQ